MLLDIETNFGRGGLSRRGGNWVARGDSEVIVMITNRREKKREEDRSGAKRTNSAYRKEIQLWLAHEPQMFTDTVLPIEKKLVDRDDVVECSSKVLIRTDTVQLTIDLWRSSGADLLEMVPFRKCAYVGTATLDLDKYRLGSGIGAFRCRIKTMISDLLLT